MHTQDVFQGTSKRELSHCHPEGARCITASLLRHLHLIRSCNSARTHPRGLKAHFEIPFPWYCSYFKGVLHQLGSGGYPFEISIALSIATTTSLGQKTLSSSHFHVSLPFSGWENDARHDLHATTHLLKDTSRQNRQFLEKRRTESQSSFDAMPAGNHHSSMSDITKGRCSSECCLDKRGS